MSAQVSALQAAYPETVRWELWTMDEHRIGLKPVLRRVWARRGQRPRAVVNHRYKWAYLYGFVHPESGRAWLPVRPKVNALEFSAALAEFARRLEVGPAKRVALLLDGAGWHRAKALVWPEGIHPIRLPAYSPELQPAEPLWPVTNENVVNRPFADLDALIAAQQARCAVLEGQPDRLRKLTCFHWWPILDANTV